MIQVAVGDVLGAGIRDNGAVSRKGKFIIATLLMSG